MSLVLLNRSTIFSRRILYSPQSSMYSSHTALPLISFQIQQSMFLRFFILLFWSISIYVYLRNVENFPFSTLIPKPFSVIFIKLSPDSFYFVPYDFEYYFYYRYHNDEYRDCDCQFTCIQFWTWVETKSKNRILNTTYIQATTAKLIIYTCFYVHNTL